MRTRERLNRGYLGGSLILATLIGVLAQSLGVFGFVFVVLVCLNLYNREIR
jgi:hypothetical protein